MPSHLTRQVFRRLLASEPIVHQDCIRRQAIRPECSLTASTKLVRRSTPHNAYPLLIRQQRRTLFSLGMFRRPSRGDAREADLDPGMQTMMDYAKMERMRARLPPVEDVAHALNRFFDAKTKQKPGIQDTQAQLVVQSLRYCLDAQKLESGQGSIVPTSVLARVAQTWSQPWTKPMSGSHVELAEIMDQILSKSTPADAYKGLQAYVTSLCRVGKTTQARELVLRREAGSVGNMASTIPPVVEVEDLGRDESASEELGSLDAKGVALWKRILSGFVRENNEAEVLTTLDMMEVRGIDVPRAASITMLKFHANRNDLEGLKHWWSLHQQRAPHADRTRKASDLIDGSAIARLLRWCLERKELAFGHEIVRDVMRTSPPKPVWDATFVWAAGTKKSVDEIDRMLTVMESSNESIADRAQWRVPDIATINNLVEFAISRNDPYMAERFISMGKDRSIEPDAKTYVLQMDYRLSVEDIDGALIAYKNLQAMDLSSNEDVPTVNRLVVALCTSKRHDFDTIMNVAADLSDRRVRFEPLTVSTLSILHLSRDEIHDVIDLLNTHSFHYSSAERDSIRDTIIAYCTDPVTSTSRSWDAYTILRNIFDETPRSQRTELMLDFFNRNRPDMAVHVFNHMRAHSRADTMPTTDTYVSAFLGSAKLRDLESLEVLHNQLKLDYNINMSTYLYNALIVSYSACDQSRDALAFWDEIVASKEGPTYNSIHCALRACEKSPFGDVKAQDIWARLRRNNVELDQGMWASYIAALAGNGDNELAFSRLEEAVDAEEVEVDAFLLGSVFSAAPGQVKQEEIEVWAKDRYPDVWREVERLGIEVGENDMKSVRIDRSVTP